LKDNHLEPIMNRKIPGLSIDKRLSDLRIIEISRQVLVPVTAMIIDENVTPVDYFF